MVKPVGECVWLESAIRSACEIVGQMTRFVCAKEQTFFDFLSFSRHIGEDLVTNIFINRDVRLLLFPYVISLSSIQQAPD